MSASEQTVTEALAPTLEPLGLLVEEVTVMPAGKRRLVRVLIDRAIELGEPITEAVEPLTLDEIADATRLISDELDATDVMGSQPYTLEVSSPGTDRPLTLPRHFARNVTRLVTLTLAADGDAKPDKVAGRITRADAEGLDLTPEQDGNKAGAPTGAQPQHFNYTSITSAKVQVEFTRAGDGDAGEDN